MAKPSKVAGRPRRRLRLPRVRSRKHGVLAAVWAILTAVLTILWLTIGGVLWFVAALVGGLATVMLAIATFDPDTVVPTQPARKPAAASPRGKSGSTQVRRKAGTAAGKPRKQTCSARCRNSTKDVASCRCVCGGKTHGIARKAGG
jgi:hypothetical protein